MNLDVELNEQQKDITKAIDGVYVAIAGPGSGKTKTLLERHIRMLMAGIQQKDILNLTFTSAAAAEMVKRVGLIKAESVFRTFHSFALELIKKEREFLPFKLSDLVIPVKGEDYQLLFDLTREYEFEDFRILKDKLSEWKRSNIEPEQAIKQFESTGGESLRLAQAYQDYEQRSREQGWLDFDSLMREAVKLLEVNEDVRKRNQKKYIAVDECQDTDITQFRFLQNLFAGNILAVGDENQLIYEWRSAQPGNLSNFSRSFLGAKTLYLGKNYRSTGALVQFFKEILPVDNGIASYMVTDNPWGVLPTFTRYSDPDTEARRVLAKATVDADNSVIIARTNRQLFEVQRIAASRGIKYKNLGKKDFWDQNEVKSLIAHAKEHITEPSAAATLAGIATSLHYHYRNSGDFDSDPIENLNRVVQLAQTKGGTVAEFLTYLNKLTHARKSRKEKDLTLATVHQAKGMEFKHVFIIGAKEGMLPHAQGEIAEEKRIFYVACSRAAETLDISWSGPRSRFIPEKYQEEHGNDRQFREQAEI